MPLTQKETALLKDLTDAEKLCIAKYSKHAASAVDVQLKDLFNKFAAEEQRHLDLLQEIEKGNTPAIPTTPAVQPSFSATYTGENDNKKNDCFLCQDLLTAEKHASHLYDTCVFEFTQNGFRDVLNHIQTEEQHHGKSIYDYMKTNSMYS